MEKEGKNKRPFFIRAKDRTPFAFAGLWETWTDPSGGEIDTAAIVTCAANETLAPIHERMPVIVPQDKFDAWLDCDRIDAKQAVLLVGKAPGDFLEAVEVSPRVNSVKNDGEENLAPAA